VNVEVNVDVAFCSRRGDYRPVSAGVAVVAVVAVEEMGFEFAVRVD